MAVLFFKGFLVSLMYIRSIAFGKSHLQVNEFKALGSGYKDII